MKNLVIMIFMSTVLIVEVIAVDKNFNLKVEEFEKTLIGTTPQYIVQKMLEGAKSSINKNIDLITKVNDVYVNNKDLSNIIYKYTIDKNILKKYMLTKYSNFQYTKEVEKKLMIQQGQVRNNAICNQPSMVAVLNKDVTITTIYQYVNENKMINKITTNKKTCQK